MSAPPPRSSHPPGADSDHGEVLLTERSDTLQLMLISSVSASSSLLFSVVAFSSGLLPEAAGRVYDPGKNETVVIERLILAPLWKVLRTANKPACLDLVSECMMEECR